MNFEDEPYIRVYKRRTTTMVVVGWQARAVLRELFLAVDRSGVLDLDDEDPADAVTAVLGDVPVEVVRDALDRLQAKKCIQINGQHLIIPRFREAQECRSSDRLRSLLSRERRRMEAMATDGTVTKCDAPVTLSDASSQADLAYPEETQEPSQEAIVTKRDAKDTKRDGAVTLSDASSRDVTPRHSVQCSTVQCSTEILVVEPPQASAQPTPKRRSPEVPIPMPADWQPSDALVAALAEKCQATPERIRQCVPEFRVYWTEGKGQSTRRSPKGWAATFSKRITVLAERGELYVGPQCAKSGPRPDKSPRQPNGGGFSEAFLAAGKAGQP